MSPAPVSRQAVPMPHLIAATRQMAVLFKAGIPLVQGLKILSDQAEHEGFKQILEAIEREVEGGSSFSKALSRYPKIFSELYVNSVAAGETGGVLELILNRLAAMLERDHEVASEVKAALRYPMMVSVVIVAAVVFMVIFIVPQFASIYARFKAELPLPTRVLIAANRFLLKGWVIYLPVSAAVFLLFRWILSTPAGRRQWDRLKLNLPIFGILFKKDAMTRFSSMLAFLYASGLPILKSLEVISRSVGNVMIKQEIEQLARSVTQGKGLAGGLKKARYFPALVRHMIAVGEASGQLQDILTSIVDYYELEVRHTVKGLNSLIEPILTFVLGMVVLGIALAIFLPMWNLTRLFRGG